MFNLNHFLAPTVGALILLAVILYKGDICPGQRGRLHKVLPIVLLGHSVAIYYSVLFVVPTLIIAFFMSQVKTGKTRVEGPRQVLISTIVYSLFTAIYLIALEDSSISIAHLIGWLFSLIILGVALTHLLLTHARTRLDTFHQLLPMVGFVSIVSYLLVMLGWVFIRGSSMSSEIESQIISMLLIALPSLILGLIIWCWHLFKHQKPNKPQLAISYLSLNIAVWGINAIMTMV